MRGQQPRLGHVEGDNVLAAMGTADDPAMSAVGYAGGVEHDEARKQPAPLLFNMKELESFRYRIEDTLRGVTGAAVKEIRAAEIKREILNSVKLKTFFAENPNDLKVCVCVCGSCFLFFLTNIFTCVHYYHHRQSHCLILFSIQYY